MIAEGTERLARALEELAGMVREGDVRGFHVRYDAAVPNSFDVEIEFSKPLTEPPGEAA